RGAIDEVLTFLHLFYGKNLRVLHGACPTGADAIVYEICRERGIAVKGYPADWDRYGKQAGFVRNQMMVDLLVKWSTSSIDPVSVQVIAFPGGNGTKHCADRAERAGIAVDDMPDSPIAEQSAPVLNGPG